MIVDQFFNKIKARWKNFAYYMDVEIEDIQNWFAENKISDDELNKLYTRLTRDCVYLPSLEEIIKTWNGLKSKVRYSAVLFSDEWVYQEFVDSPAIRICSYIENFKKDSEYTSYNISVAHAYDGLYGIYCQLKQRKWTADQMAPYLENVRKTVEAGGRVGRVAEDVQPRQGKMKKFDELPMLNFK